MNAMLLSYRRVEPPVMCTCGRSLQGLAPNDRCPGCKALVVEAPWRLFWNADRHWLRTLKDGVVWMTFGYIMMWVISVTCAAMRSTVEEPPPTMLLLLLPQVALVLGIWLAATPDPAGEGKWTAATGRMIRIMACSHFLASAFAYSCWDSEFRDYFLFDHRLEYMRSLFWAGLLTALCLRGIHLACRMQSGGLQLLCGFAMLFAVTGTIMGLAVYIPYEIANPILMPPRPSAARPGLRGRPSHRRGGRRPERHR